MRNHNLILKDVLDALAYPFCVVNAENYRVEMANAAAYNGGPIEELTCYELLHGNERPCVDDEQPCPLQVIKETKKPIILEHRHLNKEGEFQYVEVHG
ncbi:MAG: hypothetical protein KAS36_04305, partial [Anaerolineales bacterium]|nr:hypothetical protein [Anaerolineales bacterium]